MKPSGSSFFDNGGMPGARSEAAGAPTRDKPITAQRAGSMEPIVNTYPQQEGTRVSARAARVRDVSPGFPGSS